MGRRAGLDRGQRRPWLAVAGCISGLLCGCGRAARPSLPGTCHQCRVGVGKVQKTVSLLSAQVFVSVCMNLMLKQM